MMTRPSRQLAIAQRAQLPAQRLLADADRELVPDPLRQIDQPPAHDTVRGRDRTALDDLRQGLALRVIEQRRPAGRQHVDQAIRTGGVEPQDPIANRLQTNPAKLRRIAARAALINRRQGKQPTDLVASRLDRARALILAAVKSSRSANAAAIANLHSVRDP